MAKIVTVSTASHLKVAISAATTDTIIILKGANYGKLELLASREGHLGSNASIALVSEQPQKAIFTSMIVNGVNNLTLDGIMFNYMRTDGEHQTHKAFWIEHSTNVVVKNSVFDGSHANGIERLEDGYATGTALLARGNNNITFDNNELYNFFRGVEFMNCNGGTVSNNEAYDISSDGFTFAAVEDMLVVDNIIDGGLRSASQVVPLILSAALEKKEKCFGASQVLFDLVERSSRVRREQLERKFRYSHHRILRFSFEVIGPNQRIEALRKDQGRYCLPDKFGGFSCDQFIERWMNLNKHSLYGEQVPFRQLRSVCVTFMRIITMIERMDDEGQHTQQILLSIVTFVLAAEAANSDNNHSEEATARGQETGLSCQEYRQKVTGRSIFDGLVNRSALKGEARFTKRTKLKLSEGLQGNEDLNWRASEKMDFSRAARSVCKKSRRVRRSPASLRASDGGHMHRGPRAYRAIDKQEHQRATLAYQSKLQAESLCASCA